ncbi:Glucose-6-phosphate isomerase, cytosolic 1 [Glycine soja]|uniref:Glucose-6-phosphate isomerase n=1 Tax=Glycine soja TaxID=3848 RepID=A0A445FB21_GLYSO|nr:Glucose-6-phosphate isomerase, cytosolic 1 [Glycine soja]
MVLNLSTSTRCGTSLHTCNPTHLLLKCESLPHGSLPALIPIVGEIRGTAEQLQKENVPPHLVPHKTFSGNRPSLSLLLPSLNAYNIGQLLAIYEHRVAVEGFIWGINSFDQWGVELGKSLASQVRKQLNASRTKGEPVQGFNFSTTAMLTRYLQASADVPADLPTRLPQI